MSSMIPGMFSSRKKVQIKIFGVKNIFSAINLNGNLKVFFKCVPPGTKKILLHTVEVLHYRHHIKMACLVPGEGRGEAVKMPQNNL